MEVENGIIINGVLHEAIIKSELDSEFFCEDCSLYSFCHGEIKTNKGILVQTSLFGV